jgi:hypothetical protein
VLFISYKFTGISLVWVFFVSNVEIPLSPIVSIVRFFFFFFFLRREITKCEDQTIGLPILKHYASSAGCSGQKEPWDLSGI